MEVNTPSGSHVHKANCNDPYDPCGNLDGRYIDSVFFTRSESDSAAAIAIQCPATLRLA